MIPLWGRTQLLRLINETAVISKPRFPLEDKGKITMWSDDKRISAILTYARWRRHHDSLKVSPGHKFELSCEMFGEFRMLLDAQLLTTTEFHGGWLELRADDNTINAPLAIGVLLEIQKDLRAYLKRLPQDESLRSAAAQVNDALSLSDLVSSCAGQEAFNVTFAVPAAGEGSRMRIRFPGVPKPLIPIGGRPMLHRVIDTIEEIDFPANVIVIVNPNTEDIIRESLDSRRNVDFAVQASPRGTGDAVRAARMATPSDCSVLAVMFVDQPLISPGTLRALLKTHISQAPTITLATVPLEDYSGWRSVFKSWGRIVRDPQGRVIDIVESRNATPEQLDIREVNPSLYCFAVPWIWQALDRISSENMQGEFLLTDVVALAFKDGLAIESVAIENPREAVGANTPEELQVLDETLRDFELGRPTRLPSESD